MVVDLGGAPVDLLASLVGPGAGPERPDALSVAGRVLDREGLAGAAAAVAARIGGARAVAVDATASLETVVAVVGGLVAGVPVVPVPPDAGPLERGHLLRDSGAELVLAGPDGLADPDAWGSVPAVPVDVAERRAPPVGGRAAPSGSLEAGSRTCGGPSGSAGSDPAGTAPALILYTSGTTGPPKGVGITAAAIAADLDGLAEAWEWTAGDVLVHGLPLFHVHGLVLGVLGPLRAGGRLVHTGRPTAEAYAAGAMAGGSLFFGVPTVWSRVASDPAAAGALRSARLLVSGSAGLPRPVYKALAATAGQGPVERYGMTETLITLSARAAGERRVGWVGHPVAGVETRLVAEGGEPVPADGEAVGDLFVRGPVVMAGYLNRPDATAEVLGADGWFRTGDVACVDADGWHRIVGRRSTDLIKSGGYRIGAGEVEAALLAHPAVREAAVVGAPDEDLGQVVVAYVVADGIKGDELVDFVASQLSVHKRPRRVELVATLPRNAMGKVQKQQLLAGS